MKKEVIILLVLAAGAYFWFRRKDATENLGPTEDITPEAGSVSADAVMDYDGTNMTREQQIESMIEAVGAAGRAQMAASSGGYAAIVDAFDNVDASKLTYEQRSQMAASQSGSAVVRAQVAGKAVGPAAPTAPVKAPVSRQTLATTKNMKGLAPVSTAAAAARGKALLEAQRAQTKVKNASLSQQASSAVARAKNEATRIAAMIKKPVALPSAVARTAAEVRGAAAVAAAMKPSFSAETGQTSVLATTPSAPRTFGFGVES